jgi:hypothetical protein
MSAASSVIILHSSARWAERRALRKIQICWATRRSERGRRTVHPVVRRMARSAMLAWDEITGRILEEYGQMLSHPS